MRISKVRVQNFRCIKDATIKLDSLTVLIGRNGTGKSSFLRALDLFFNANAKYSADDFYNRDTSQPICIVVTFTDLTLQEKELFRPYLDGETLTVEKELIWPRSRSSQKYYGMEMRCPDFEDIRKASRITDKRRIYKELRQQERFADLPELPGNASGQRIDEALKEWENKHPEYLKRFRDDGQFFGFKEVGRARLERFTSFVFVPAVRDAAEDATEGKGHAITELMDILVRSTLEQREEIKKLKEETQQRYNEIVAPEEGLSELVSIEKDLRETLQTFAPNTSLYIDWNTEQEISIPLPLADIKLEEDGYKAPVDKVGHGLQRAFIFTILQRLKTIKRAQLNSKSEEESSEGVTSVVEPSVILAIEEVELYQHPSRQRHLAKVLLELSENPPPGFSNMQIIYTTHSPLFVDLERFHQIRLLRKKIKEHRKPKVTIVNSANMWGIVRKKEELDEAQPGTYNIPGEIARFRTLMTPWTNEGFFADVVVLVEGEEDRAALLGVAKYLGIDFESMNIAVIPVNGKTNLIKAALIFQSFNIPVYMIWDSDADKSRDGYPETNRKLLKLFKHPEEDFPEKITDNFACFRENLTKTLCKEIGEDIYRDIVDEIKEEYGFQEDKQARKNPAAVEELIRRAATQERQCSTLEKIIMNIEGLRRETCETPVS